MRNDDVQSHRLRGMAVMTAAHSSPEAMEQPAPSPDKGAGIEDYAIISNSQTLALVCRGGSIDWLCIPRFDSDACFASLLGTPDNGCWRLAPVDEVTHCRRSYRDGTLVLETELTCAEGCVRLIDCMHTEEGGYPQLLRLVQGVEGRVRMHMHLCFRFGYGHIVPWVTHTEDNRLEAIAGPDRVVLDTPVELVGKDLTTQADFTVSPGDSVPFALTWTPSWLPKLPSVPDVPAAVESETHTLRSWSDRCRKAGPWTDLVKRSLITLRALTNRDTGGIVAAGTTSLPEEIGGTRNWDYRYCWLRDATLTLRALVEAGFTDEAGAWRDWLLRAVAGDATQLRIMYGVAGEQRLAEYELPWLQGYEGSVPVRVGNAASNQLQLDVYGEVINALHLARRHGLAESDDGWRLQCLLVRHLEKIWGEPDEGIWEIRGPRRHFTYSKVMAWVAFDRMIRSAETFGLEGPLDSWRTIRREIHENVCQNGFNAAQGSFMQYYGARDELDASLLQIPLVGFLPITDPRVMGTIAAIEGRLTKDGFVRRYANESDVDGLAGIEGVFLACSFWLVDCMVLQKRLGEARTLFERLLGLCNDVGLLSEEYDTGLRRHVGNTPQAFSHVGLVNAAYNLSEALWPEQYRRKSPHRDR